MPDTETLTPDQVAHIESRWITDGLSADETDEAIGALCHSLRAAWANELRLAQEVVTLRTQNQTQAESITYFQENEKSLKAQLDEVQKRLDDAPVRAAEDQDEHSAQRAELAKKLKQAAEKLKAQEDRNTIRIDGTL